MNARNTWMRPMMILAVWAIGFAFTARMNAQVQTTTTEEAGMPTQQVTVDRAEVIAVSGNDVVVKMEDGSLRHIANVPESARAIVDGKEVGIHDLKPGMRLERTLTTTTTPKVITTTQTLTGTVWQVNPPSSLILSLENGQYKQFTIPKGQKFIVDGKVTDAFDLKKGMKVTGTKIVEEPVTVVEQQAKVTGHMPTPPPPPLPDIPILIAVVEAPAPAPAAPTEAMAELPKTGSELPFIALLGIISMAGATGVRIYRKVRG